MRVLLGLLCLALLGCGAGVSKREPPPLYVIEILSPYEYVLDGEPMSRGQLQDRLRAIAEQYRRPVVHNARVHLHIYGAGPDTGDEIQRLASWCIQQGLDKIRIGR